MSLILFFNVSFINLKFVLNAFVKVRFENFKFLYLICFIAKSFFLFISLKAFLMILIVVFKLKMTWLISLTTMFWFIMSFINIFKISSFKFCIKRVDMIFAISCEKSFFIFLTFLKYSAYKRLFCFNLKRRFKIFYITFDWTWKKKRSIKTVLRAF